ncbi:hypothetical protein D3C86_1064250 [compost metagenome]
MNPVEIGPGHTQLLGQPLRQPALARAGVADDQGSGEVHERHRSIVGVNLLAKAVLQSALMLDVLVLSRASLQVHQNLPACAP